MKYIITVFALFFSISAFAQKEHPERAVVKETAHRFIKLLIAEEYDEAKSISTKETIKILDQIKMFASMVPDSMQAEMTKVRDDARKASYTFTEFDFEEKNDKTVCTVSFTISTEPSKTEKIYLEKSNDSWLVNFDLKEVMETDAVDAAEEAVEATEEEDIE